VHPVFTVLYRHFVQHKKSFILTFNKGHVTFILRTTLQIATLKKKQKKNGMSRDPSIFLMEIRGCVLWSIHTERVTARHGYFCLNGILLQ
jgi:hypothetical protein